MTARRPSIGPGCARSRWARRADRAGRAGRVPRVRLAPRGRCRQRRAVDARRDRWPGAPVGLSAVRAVAPAVVGAAGRDAGPHRRAGDRGARRAHRRRAARGVSRVGGAAGRRDDQRGDVRGGAGGRALRVRGRGVRARRSGRGARAVARRRRRTAARAVARRRAGAGRGPRARRPSDLRADRAGRPARRRARVRESRARPIIAAADRGGPVATAAWRSPGGTRRGAA
jgi:hypothetical protein